MLNSKEEHINMECVPECLL